MDWMRTRVEPNSTGQISGNVPINVLFALEKVIRLIELKEQLLEGRQAVGGPEFVPS